MTNQGKNKNEDEKIWKMSLIFEFTLSKLGYMGISMEIWEKMKWKCSLTISLFKACVRDFYQIFIFLPNDNPSKTMKNAFYFI